MAQKVKRKITAKTAIIIVVASHVVIFILGAFFSTYVPPSRRLYQGDNPELYSIAINSVLGTRGSGFDSRPMNLAKATIIEEDSYGRKMFLYYEHKMISEYSLHISQTSDESYAYFYPDFNFISGPEDEFSDEAIEELKRENDWNMEIDLSKCVKVEIVREKSQGPLEKSQILSSFQKVFENSSPSSIYFITDDYGRSMYLGIARFLNGDDGYGFDKIIVMMFNPDGSYDESTGWFELTDFFSYQEELKQFKELNNWNMPLY